MNRVLQLGGNDPSVQKRSTWELRLWCKLQGHNDFCSCHTCILNAQDGQYLARDKRSNVPHEWFKDDKIVSSRKPRDKVKPSELQLRVLAEIEELQGWKSDVQWPPDETQSEPKLFNKRSSNTQGKEALMQHRHHSYEAVQWAQATENSPAFRKAQSRGRSPRVRRKDDRHLRRCLFLLANKGHRWPNKLLKCVRAHSPHVHSLKRAIIFIDYFHLAMYNLTQVWDWTPGSPFPGKNNTKLRFFQAPSQHTVLSLFRLKTLCLAPEMGRTSST